MLAKRKIHITFERKSRLSGVVDFKVIGKQFLLRDELRKRFAYISCKRNMRLWRDFHFEGIVALAVIEDNSALLESAWLRTKGGLVSSEPASVCAG